MDYKKLLKALLCDGSGVGEDINGCTNKKCKYRDGDGGCNLVRMCGDAAIAINELLVENQALRNAANGFKKQLESTEARAERVERERDVAIKMLRKIEWCNGCKNFRGLQGWQTIVGCSECPVLLLTITYDTEEIAQKKAIKQWNTRPAPPVGKCGECKAKEKAVVNDKGFLICPSSGMEITDNDFCSYFEPKEE